MSRSAVGDVYAKVIREVIDQSRNDFEEGGVDEGTLDLLKSEWQKKLSQLKVAQLPWDPAPTAPAATTTATLPSNNKPPPQTLPSNGHVISTPPSNNSTPGPQIKQESNAYSSRDQQAAAYQMPVPYPPGMQLNARQRAAMNLHNAYGVQAGPQISQLQQGSMPRVPSQQPSGLIKQEDSKDQKPTLSGLPDYPGMIQQSPSAPIKSSQNDGAGDSFDDWKAEVARRKEMAAKHRGEADRSMHDLFVAMQSRMEGGGLMLPLDERRPARRTKRGVSGVAKSVTTGETFSSLPRAQGDAPGEDEDTPEADEDAINSDLDDPDDAGGEEDNEEMTDQVMLCTYDKVQRVKNKWKCTLKDGVLRVDGSEYVFHKGQGEFEW